MAKGTSESDPHRWVDERELAQLVGIKPNTLQKWRLRGAGPPFCRFGKAIRYRLDKVLAWAEHRGAA